MYISKPLVGSFPVTEVTLHIPRNMLSLQFQNPHKHGVNMKAPRRKAPGLSNQEATHCEAAVLSAVPQFCLDF